MSKVMKLVKNATTLEFDPGEGYVEPQLLDRSTHRSLSGKSYIYTWFSKGRWEIPLSFFSLSEADTVNEWWMNGETLNFYPDLINSPAVFYVVQIMNKEKPLAGFPRSHWKDRWMGTLMLEES